MPEGTYDLPDNMDLVPARLEAALHRLREIADLTNQVLQKAQESHKWAMFSLSKTTWARQGNGDALSDGLAKVEGAFFDIEQLIGANALAGRNQMTASAARLGSAMALDLARHIDQMVLGCRQMTDALGAMRDDRDDDEPIDRGTAFYLYAAQRLLMWEARWARGWADRSALEMSAEEDLKKDQHALRTRRHRARKRHGFKVASLNYHKLDVARLVRAGLLSSTKAPESEVESALDLVLQIALEAMDGEGLEAGVDRELHEVLSLEAGESSAGRRIVRQSLLDRVINRMAGLAGVFR